MRAKVVIENDDLNDMINTYNKLHELMIEAYELINKLTCYTCLTVKTEYSADDAATSTTE